MAVLVTLAVVMVLLLVAVLESVVKTSALVIAGEFCYKLRKEAVYHYCSLLTDHKQPSIFILRILNNYIIDLIHLLILYNINITRS